MINTAQQQEPPMQERELWMNPGWYIGTFLRIDLPEFRSRSMSANNTSSADGADVMLTMPTVCQWYQQGANAANNVPESTFNQIYQSRF